MCCTLQLMAKLGDSLVIPIWLRSSDLSGFLFNFAYVLTIFIGYTFLQNLCFLTIYGIIALFSLISQGQVHVIIVVILFCKELILQEHRTTEPVDAQNTASAKTDFARVKAVRLWKELEEALVDRGEALSKVTCLRIAKEAFRAWISSIEA